MNANGLLIMFDGPDGVGKTTQFELAAKELQDQGHTVYTTHLLGGTEIGEALRAVMFSEFSRPALTNMHVSLAIYMALAAELEDKRAEGTIILVDRSPLSLLAYQVYGDGVDEQIGLAACKDSLTAFRPDTIFLYSAPMETLQARRTVREKATDYFEQQQLSYHERTAAGYKAASQQFNVVSIPAEGSVEAVHAATMAELRRLL